MNYSERMQIVRAIEEEFSITVQTDIKSEWVLIPPSYEIVLKGYSGSNRIKIIKLLRELLNIGLVEAKRILEDGDYPIVICSEYKEMTRSEAERETHAIMEGLRAAGAEVEMHFDYGNYID